jgi:hypothetical protein
MRRLLPLLAAFVLALGPRLASAQTPSCRFVLGFAALRDAIGPSRVGDCLEDEQHGANGDGLQRTTGGLLVWRKADGLTAFTDGFRTWIAGPDGVRTRLNSERFAWEPPERLSWPSGRVPPERVGELARAEVARVFGLPLEQVAVVRVEPIEWRDAALGCSQPGFAYAAVIVPGQRVALDVLGRPVHVHVGGSGALLCPSPTE